MTSINVLKSPNNKLKIQWEIGLQHKRVVENFYKKSFEQLILALRFYDVTNVNFNGGNANYFHEVIVSHSVNSWTLKNVKEDRTYCVELGLSMNETKFLPILRSNIVSTHTEIKASSLKKDVENPQFATAIWANSFSTYSLYEGLNGWKRDTNG